MKLPRELIWPLGLAVAIFAASSTSQLAAPSVNLVLPTDKVAHFLVFGLVATSIIRIPWFRRKGWAGVLLVIIITSTFGALDEYRQSFTPGRTVEFADWIADTLGGALAAILYHRWHWYRAILERSPRRSRSDDSSPRDRP